MLNRHAKDLELDNLVFNSTYSDIKSNGVTNVDDYTTRYGIENLRIKARELIVSSLDDNENTLDNINNVVRLLDSDMERLDWKINQAIERVKGAILAERRMTGVVYSNIVQLNTGINKNTTTATISNNVILGLLNTTNDNYLTNVKPLLTTNISITDANNNQINYKDLIQKQLQNFTITPMNKMQSVIELVVNLQGLVPSSSSVVVTLKEHQILEILKNGNLYQSKSLSNNFTIPVSSSDTSVTLRFYPIQNKQRPISFVMLGLTNLIYQTEVEFETNNININQTLAYLSIDTCDNSDDKNINIDYYLSINGSTYEQVSPTGKGSAKHVQSIITLDKSEDTSLLPVLGKRVSQSNITFDIPNALVNSTVYEIASYIPCLTEATSMQKQLYISLQEDKVINTASLLGTGNRLYVDNVLVEYVGNFTLLKGIRTILVTDNSNVIQSCNYNYLSNIVGAINIYNAKYIKNITSRAESSKYITFTENELLDIIDFSLADSVTDKYRIFIANINQAVNITNIKIKGILTSLDKKTCPYISRIIVKGV